MRVLPWWTLWISTATNHLGKLWPNSHCSPTWNDWIQDTLTFIISCNRYKGKNYNFTCYELFSMECEPFLIRCEKCLTFAATNYFRWKIIHNIFNKWDRFHIMLPFLIADQREIKKVISRLKLFTNFLNFASWCFKPLISLNQLYLSLISLLY